MEKEGDLEFEEGLALLKAAAGRAGASCRLSALPGGGARLDLSSGAMRFERDFPSREEALSAGLALACSGRPEWTGGLAGPWSSREEAAVRLAAEGLLEFPGKGGLQGRGSGL